MSPFKLTRKIPKRMPLAAAGPQRPVALPAAQRQLCAQLLAADHLGRAPAPGCRLMYRIGSARGPLGVLGLWRASQ